MLSFKRLNSTLRLKIPLPDNLRKLKELNHTIIKKSDNDKIVKKRQYSDNEVMDKINSICNVLSVQNDIADSKDVNEVINLNIASNKLVLDSTMSPNDKVNALCKFLSVDSNSEYLPLKISENPRLKTPFEELCDINKSNKNNDKTRLSVTKIIPYSYCELMKIYELYLRDKKVDNINIIKGKQIHRDLELDNHPQMKISIHSNDGDNIVGIDKPVSIIDKNDPIFEVKRDIPFSNIDKISLKKLVTPDNTIESDRERQINHLNQLGVEPTDDSVVSKQPTMIDKTTKMILEVVNKEPVIEVIPVIEETKPVFVEDEIPLESEIKTTTDEQAMFEIMSETALFDTQLHKITQSMLRTINLFFNGSSREVLVHGFYSASDNTLSNIDNLKDGVIISGIIDDITIASNSENAFEAFSKELKKELDGVYDLDIVFQKIEEKVNYWTDKNFKDSLLYLVINDDKTTARGNVPNAQTRCNHLTQVGIYGMLLTNLVKNLNFTYNSWLENLISRGENVNEPLNNDMVSFCSILSDYLLNDFLKLKNGKSFSFEKNKTSHTNSITEERYKFTNKSNSKKLDILNGEWVNSPTLSHIIMRLAQSQMLLKPLIYNKTQITYISQLTHEQVKVIENTYNSKEIKNQVDLGMDLWFGKRDPEPTNNERICNYCMFNKKCQIPKKRLGLL